MALDNEPGPSSLRQSIAHATNTFTSALDSLSASLSQHWLDQSLDIHNAEASLNLVSPKVTQLLAELEKILNTSKTTDSLVWTTFKEITAAQIRLHMAATLGNIVVLDDQQSILFLYANLDVATALQEVDLVDGSLSLLLIEEAMERMTVDSAGKVFEYLESRVTYLTRVSSLYKTASRFGPL